MGSATGGACCADEAEACAATEGRRRWGNGITADGNERAAAMLWRAVVAAPPRRDAAKELLLTLRVFIGSGCCLER